MYAHPCGLVYLANPRTASRATADLLLRVGFIMEGSHHSRYEDYVSGPRRPEKLWIVTTVRDEDEMRASWARHLGTTPEAVEAMMPANRHIIANWTTGWFPHLAQADQVLNYRRLQEELHAVLDAHGLPLHFLRRIE